MAERTTKTKTRKNGATVTITRGGGQGRVATTTRKKKNGSTVSRTKTGGKVTSMTKTNKNGVKTTYGSGTKKVAKKNDLIAARKGTGGSAEAQKMASLKARIKKAKAAGDTAKVESLQKRVGKHRKALNAVSRKTARATRKGEGSTSGSGTSASPTNNARKIERLEQRLAKRTEAGKGTRRLSKRIGLRKNLAEARGAGQTKRAARIQSKIKTRRAEAKARRGESS